MNNKVLIKLFVPELDCNFDIFIPVNELVWKIKRMLVKSISDLTGTTLEVNDNYTLINKITSEIYDNNAIVVNTNIRNVTELVLLSTKESIINVTNML